MMYIIGLKPLFNISLHFFRDNVQWARRLRRLGWGRTHTHPCAGRWYNKPIQLIEHKADIFRVITTVCKTPSNLCAGLCEFALQKGVRRFFGRWRKRSVLVCRLIAWSC